MKNTITAEQFLEYLKWRVMAEVNFDKEITLLDIEERFGTDDIEIENGEIINPNFKKWKNDRNKNLEKNL